MVRKMYKHFPCIKYIFDSEKNRIDGLYYNVLLLALYVVIADVIDLWVAWLRDVDKSVFRIKRLTAHPVQGFLYSVGLG